MRRALGVDVTGIAVGSLSRGGGLSSGLLCGQRGRSQQKKDSVTGHWIHWIEILWGVDLIPVMGAGEPGIFKPILFSAQTPNERARKCGDDDKKARKNAANCEARSRWLCADHAVNVQEHEKKHDGAGNDTRGQAMHGALDQPMEHLYPL
jgi:hypothetical protein